MQKKKQRLPRELKKQLKQKVVNDWQFYIDYLNESGYRYKIVMISVSVQNMLKININSFCFCIWTYDDSAEYNYRYCLKIKGVFRGVDVVRIKATYKEVKMKNLNDILYIGRNVLIDANGNNYQFIEHYYTVKRGKAKFIDSNGNLKYCNAYAFNKKLKDGTLDDVGLFSEQLDVKSHVHKFTLKQLQEKLNIR